MGERREARELRSRSGDQPQRAVLDVAPEHPGSHHLLGLVEHQLGRHDAALQSIKRAIEFNGLAEILPRPGGCGFKARPVVLDDR